MTINDNSEFNTLKKREILNIDFDTNTFYFHCMYCHGVYDYEQKQLLYQGQSRTEISNLFDGYKLSSRICKQPQCMEELQKQYDEIKRYKNDK